MYFSIRICIIVIVIIIIIIIIIIILLTTNIQCFVNKLCKVCMSTNEVSKFFAPIYDKLSNPWLTGLARGIAKYE